MPRGDWRKFGQALGLSLVGLVAAGGLALAALYSHREFYQPAEQNQSVQHYQPARDATQPTAPTGKLPSQTYDPHCQQPQSHDDADLCAQWAAVRAVSETNRLTRVALKLGYVGFWVALMGGVFGILGTALIWLAWQETKAGNVIAQAALVAETRPILLFKEFRLSGRAHADAWTIWRPIWVNHGKDPCKITRFECSRCYADHAFLEEFIQDLKAIEEPIRSLDKTVILAAGQEFVGDELLIKDDQLLTGMRLGPEKRPMSATGYPEKWELAIFWTKFSYISAFAPDHAKPYQIDAIQTCVLKRDRSGFVFDSPPGHTSMT